jgi:NhaA family Na+:H+ antiporter
MTPTRPWRTAVPRFSQWFVEGLLVLPLGAVIALVWVHADPESYFRFTFAASFAVNDVAMAFFFGLMMKEIVEATAAGGVLHPWRRAVAPVVIAVVAAIVPALLHIRIVDALDEPMLYLGWPVSLATDLALCYFVARLVFRRHPIIAFLLLFGIASDAIGLLVIAFFNPARDLHPIGGLLLLAAAMGLAAGLRCLRVRSFWPYLLGAGLLSWFAFFWGGVHPALALVPIVPFLPHAERDPGFFVDAPATATDTLSRFEIWWRYPAQIALLFFAIVNAGVPFSSLEPGTWGLPIALIVGKPLGMLLGAGAALISGFHLPQRVGWRELVVAGFIAAMGFTVGLFFCQALLPPGQVSSELRMGVLLGLAGAPIALMSAWLLRTGRFARR